LPQLEKDDRFLPHLELFRQKDQSQVSDASRRKLEKHLDQGPHRTQCYLPYSNVLSMEMPIVPEQGHAKQLPPGFSIETARG
jgi:hypothetical protein